MHTGPQHHVSGNGAAPASPTAGIIGLGGGRYTDKMRRFVRKAVRGKEETCASRATGTSAAAADGVIADYPPAFESLGGTSVSVAAVMTMNTDGNSSNIAPKDESCRSDLSDTSRTSATAAVLPPCMEDSDDKGDDAMMQEAYRHTAALGLMTAQTAPASPLRQPQPSPPWRRLHDESHGHDTPSQPPRTAPSYALVRTATTRNLTFATPPSPAPVSTPRATTRHHTHHHPLECNHRMVNVDRAKYNLRPLIRDVSLDELARAHAQKMATEYQLSYPNSSPQDFRQIGINVCRGTLAIPELHRQLIQSEERHNLLTSHFTHMGCGTAVSKDGVYYLCQIVGRKKKQIF